MAFKNAENVAKLAAPVKVTMPEVAYTPKVQAAGLQGHQRLAVTIAITQWKGNLSGAQGNSMGARAHRLEVARMCNFDECNDDNFAWLKTRLGAKRNDRTLRPDLRSSIVMYRTLHGLEGKALRPWLEMYDEVAKAIAYCQHQVALCNGAEHYGLIMLIDVSQWRLMTPNNPHVDNFHEAALVGIADLEVVRLAPEPTIDLPDGFGEDKAYVPQVKPEPITGDRHDDLILHGLVDEPNLETPELDEAHWAVPSGWVEK